MFWRFLLIFIVYLIGFACGYGMVSERLGRERRKYYDLGRSDERGRVLDAIAKVYSQPGKVASDTSASDSGVDSGDSGVRSDAE